MMSQVGKACCNALDFAKLALPYNFACSVFPGLEHILHPSFAPGVPLEKLTPAWIPVAPLWGYFTGAALLTAGVALLVKRKDRIAVAWTGILIIILVLFIYLPLLPLASKGSEINEATNYIADTLLFAGALLVLAGALGKPVKAPAVVLAP